MSLLSDFGPEDEDEWASADEAIRRGKEARAYFEPPFHLMCRCVVVPIPGVLEATERAMLSLILDVPYEWAYEYIEVRIKQIRASDADS